MTEQNEPTPDAPPGDENESREENPITKAVAGLKLRSIGPALMGGRIADIAVHPHKSSTWYVAVGSGGLWKTTNAGTTWNPVFDKQASYSIGCVTIDPNNPDLIWVGTGENVSGRHVAWGDGIYRSLNGGKTWECMGLSKSEHISRIIVDPRNSNVVFAAAEGPLWSSGGDRGVYKTSDGGKNWELVLEIDADTGATDVLFAPNNPDILYAATYQRRRHIWSFLAAGPGSGIHKSTDGGKTWRKITEGLPKSDKGKIGLAVTPADPDLVYATIEADEKECGFYRSQDKGESWEKRSSYISSGTGAHYYQEIAASPHDPDCVYQMDVFVNVTRDGGKNFTQLESGKTKHSDNHAIWIDPGDKKHLLVGSDAGLYESFDDGDTWRHFPNLPVSQFYRVSLDNSEPFFNILGGAQDLGTLFGPSRTLNVDGVRNQDWYVPLGADGYHVAFDPDDPQTFYLEWQQGNVLRHDRRSEEAVDIKPQPEPGEPPERWNWDTPIFISPHSSRRIYVGSQRLWRSDDRGDSWKPISGDLTHNRNRYELPMFDKVWSVDALYDHSAMSQYATITHISESRIQENVLYVGTDDGLLQVTKDGGENWDAAAAFPDVPEYSFVNDVEASYHDASGVFAVIDAHKIGDYKPYVFESNDFGKSWHSITGDLPEGTIVWALEQDHKNPDLIFLATEYGIYFSVNHGKNWHKLSGDVPTIAFRDIKLHRRDDDLVGASFGRGFYVLDDYTALRSISEKLLAEKASLFPVRDAWMYVPYEPMQARGQPTLGSSAFRGPNPPFGALLTYHLNDDIRTSKEARHKNEAELRKAGENIPFPGWDELRKEATERDPQVVVAIRDHSGAVVRLLSGPHKAGLHRINWDLRLSPPDPISLQPPEFSPWRSPPRGPFAKPGKYQAELMLVIQGSVESFGPVQEFNIKPVPTLPEQTKLDVVTDFQKETSELIRQMAGASKEIERTEDRLNHLFAALIETPQMPLSFTQRLSNFKARLADLKRQLDGDEVRQTRQHYEAVEPAARFRVGRVAWMHWDSRQMPTKTQQRAIEIAREEFEGLRSTLIQMVEIELVQLETELTQAGAPWTPGRRL